ncbi:hypothetical protein AFE02nite_12910 [Actinotalea fermentans]|uniref:Uncharacterized protein n=1 Tax=Actinotalea fermentans TaxID=43671 RepID=A0A511YWH4_9CELL|nr:hypothetical protein AFE02nite_12910 [Actinotalea fermentans]
MPVPGELAALVRTLRAAGQAPAPAPSAELARVLAEGQLPDVVPLERRRAARPMTRRAVVAAALGTKIALVSAAAAAALTGVATLEPVPDVIRDPARDLVDDVVDVLPWTSQEPAVPADEAPGVSPRGAGSSPDEGRGDSDGQGEEGAGDGTPGRGVPATPATPAVPGDDAGRSDEAPGRPDEPADPEDDAPGRSEEAPGRPESPGQEGQRRATPPADRTPAPPVGTGASGSAGVAGVSGTAAGEVISVQPYPSDRVGR